MKQRTTMTIGLATAFAVVLSGCSSKASDSGSGGGADGDVKTDVGVTDTEITLGALTDATGPFKAGSVLVTHGNQIWADEVNAAGGICGRDIKLDVRDTGYKADQAIPLYDQLNTTSVGMIQIIGSAVFAALKQKMVADNFIGSSPTIASVNLDTKIMLSVGTTYDIEMINALSFLQEKGLLKDGDKIGSIHLANEAGENSHLGVKAYAEEHNLQVVEAPVAATDTDMTSTITKFKSEGIKVMVLAIAPAAMSSAAIQAQDQGLDIPMMGFNPAFQPSVLQNADVIAALEKNFYVAEPNVVYNSANEKATWIRDQYDSLGTTDAPSTSTITGYLSGLAWGAILEQACEDGDMTRAGILAAREKVDSLDTEGLTGALDFSKPGNPVTRETVIAQIDPSAPGGLKEVSELFESDEAKAYKAPYQE